MLSSHFSVENTSISGYFEESRILHQERKQPSVAADTTPEQHHFESPRGVILHGQKGVYIDISNWDPKDTLHDYYDPSVLEQGEEETLLPSDKSASIDKLAFVLKRRSTIAPWLVKCNKNNSSQTLQSGTAPSRRALPVIDTIREIPQRWDTTSSLADSPRTQELNKRRLSAQLSKKLSSEVSLLPHTSDVVSRQETTPTETTQRWETGSSALVDRSPVSPKRAWRGAVEVLAYYCELG